MKPPPHPISELMDEAQFWQLIENALNIAKQNDDYQEEQIAQATALSDALHALDWQEVVAFHNRLNALMAVSYLDTLWCAAYIMQGGCSDDGFEYFRRWLISRGQSTFESAITHPDSLAAQMENNRDHFEFEDLAFVAADVFAEQTGHEIYDYSHYTDYPELTFSWEEDDEDSMRRLCPKLYAMQQHAA